MQRSECRRPSLRRGTASPRRREWIEKTRPRWRKTERTGTPRTGMVTGSGAYGEECGNGPQQPKPEGRRLFDRNEEVNVDRGTAACGWGCSVLLRASFSSSGRYFGCRIVREVRAMVSPLHPGMAAVTPLQCGARMGEGGGKGRGGKGREPPTVEPEIGRAGAWAGV